MNEFALAIASNLNAQENISWAFNQLRHLGHLQQSDIFEIPCRDGVGADYLNSACLVKTSLNKSQIEQYIKNLEVQAGRIRPSHNISLDIDLIAWKHKDIWHFNQKKMPFPLDVKTPMYELIQHSVFAPD